MPLLWLVTMCSAANQIRSGNLRRCMAEPAVTEVCRRQPAHSQSPRSAARSEYARVKLGRDFRWCRLP